MKDSDWIGRPEAGNCPTRPERAKDGLWLDSLLLGLLTAALMILTLTPG
jgi:hypothetical protein